MECGISGPATRVSFGVGIACYRTRAEGGFLVESGGLRGPWSAPRKPPVWHFGDRVTVGRMKAQTGRNNCQLFDIRLEHWSSRADARSRNTDLLEGWVGTGSVPPGPEVTLTQVTYHVLWLFDHGAARAARLLRTAQSRP